MFGFHATRSPPDFPTELTALYTQVGHKENKNFLAFSSSTRVSCRKIISCFVEDNNLRMEGNFRGPPTPLIFRVRRIMIYP
jgi:hypothetical protein